MSSTVDTRVVQIKFDNKEFERNVQQTIDSLERLNQTIEAANSGKGLSSLTDGLNGQALGSISAGVDSIKDRFSALGIVGMTVIQRITNAGIDMALKVGNSIKRVGDQISQGGFIRAQNLEQAKFLLKGLGANVEAVMKDVDEALTGTAYGLDEGAKSAAIFFTSGIKQGKEMYTALRAVAGAAAMTGNSYQGIADVFQDAAAKGSVMTMEIQRLQQQGVKADKYLLDFINDVVDGGDKVSDVSDSVKKQVMDLTNGTKMSLEDLTEDRKGLLSKGAISFEVFAAAMDAAFGEHAQKANETFSGSLANMKTALSRLGEAFISPGMQAAIPLFNSIQQAIKNFADTLSKTTSMTSYYTDIVTDIGKAMSGFVDKAVKLGIVSTFAEIVYKSFLILVRVLGSVRDAFEEAFPNATLNNLKKNLDSLKDAIDNVYKDQIKSGGFVKLKDALVDFLNVVKTVAAPFKTAFGIIKNQAGNLFSILGNLANVAGVILTVAFNALNGVIKRLANPIDFVMQAFVKLSDAINKGFSGSGITSILVLFGKAFDSVSKIIGFAVDKIVEYFHMLTSTSKDSISQFVSIRDVLDALGVAIGGGLLAKGIKTLFDVFQTKNGIKDFIEELKESIKDVPDKISGTFEALTSAIEDMTNKIKADMLKQIALGVLALAIALKILSTLSIEELATTLSAVTILLWELSITIERLFSMVEGAKMKDLKGLSTVTTALMKLGVALLIMAVALKIISTIEYHEMAAGMAAMIVMLGSIMGFVIGIDKLGGRKAGKSLEKVAGSLTSIAIALLILAAAVKVLSSMNIEELGKGLGSIVVLLGAIMGFIVALDKLSKGGGKGMISAGIGMIAIAASLNILVPVLQKLGGMDLPQLAQGIIAIVVAMGSMATASQFMSAGGAVGMLVMSAALGSLVTAIERMGSLPMNVITQGLFSLVSSLLLFGLVSVALSGAIPAMLGLAGAMLLLSTAIAVLGAGLVMIGAGLAGIAAGIASFAALSQTAVLMFANTIQTLVIALIQTFPQIAVALARSFVVFLEEIAALAPRFREAMTTIITELLGAVNDNLPRIISTGLHLILGFLSGLEEAMPQIAEKAANIIAGFIEGIAAGLPRIIQAGFDLMLAFINGLADGIRNNQDAVNKAIWNLCTALLDGFKSFFGIHSPSTVMEEQGVNLVQGLINGITSLAGSVGGYLVTGIKTGLNKLSGFAGSFKTKGAELIKSVGAGIKGKASDIKTKVSDAVKKAKDKVGDYKDGFKSAGRSLAEGIGKGINSATSWVKTQVANLADALKRKVKEKLDINSPSKVFAKIAEGIPEGMALGVERAGHYAVKAVSDLADSTIEPVAKALSDVEKVMGLDSDFNPTITPVLDLSEIRKEAGNIGSMFGNETVSLASSIGSNQANQNINMMNQLMNKMNSILSKNADANKPNVTNYITIDGASDPADFAETFVDKMEMILEMGG